MTQMYTRHQRWSMIKIKPSNDRNQKPSMSCLKFLSSKQVYGNGGIGFNIFLNELISSQTPF